MRFSWFLFAICIAGCGSNPESFTNAPNRGEGAPGEAAESGKTRDTSPNVSDDDLAALTSGNADFAWNLYREVIEPDQNVFFSPFSLSVALAMTWAGARGSTETQMAEALRFDLGQKRLHSAFNRLELELASRADGASDPDTLAPDALPFELNVSNGLFAQVGFTFADSFLDDLAVNYGAGVRLMDFENDSAGAASAINAWVAERTNDRIKDLLQGLSPLTRLVLVNTILFTASWAEAFDESQTKDLVFHRADGSEVVASGMNQVVSAGYARGDGFAVVALPYDGFQLSMLVVVPDAGELESIEGSLSADWVAGALGQLSPHDVTITLPKFTFRSRVPIKEPLRRLGMSDAFMGVADFSGMTGGENGLFIQDVIHEAFVAVDERGTEATAATAVVVGVESSPPAATLVVDRPFIFAILDRPTGAMLFAGRVMDPTQ
ncbi:MAG: serpin family protein [Myxococcota bacterium]